MDIYAHRYICMWIYNIYCYIFYVLLYKYDIHKCYKLLYMLYNMVIYINIYITDIKELKAA